MLVGAIFFLNLWNLVPANEDAMCDRNRTLLETSGDAVIGIFVDTNYGPYCNISSPKGFQEVSTALYVVETLNKYDYIPGLSLGIKMFDTCHDKIAVYKQALMAAVNLDCETYYELGLLIPEEHWAIVEPLQQFSLLPISTYKEQNFTKSLVDIMVHFISTKFEVVDLFLTTSDFALTRFLDTSKVAGICVKSYTEMSELDNNTDVVIAIAGHKEDIRLWIENGERIVGPKKTWVVLPLDGAHVDDIIPSGSYVVKAEPFAIDLLREFSSTDKFPETTGQAVIHSPYLLSIGKAIIEIAQTLQDIQKQTCPQGASCVLPHFDVRPKPDISNFEVYDALRILPKSHSVKFVVVFADTAKGEEIEVARYKVDATSGRVKPEKNYSKMARLCLNDFFKNCHECANFRKARPANLSKSTAEKGVLKRSGWVPIYLTVAVCGTFACAIIIIFIVYRLFAEDILDGNPTLTVVLIMSTVFLLQTVVPFCMNDEFMGREYLNARKIFVSTLSIGVVFSIMLSRALFLAFSTGGIFTTHINGYLQGLMVFFMAGVQIAISTMFFVLNREDSATMVRSLMFIALLGYDIFLLVKLFVVCCFIAQVQRNYREGKCFFGTVIGLLVVWAVWVTCFVLVEPELRDDVVCFGTIATAYFIILGVLIPRTYYMVTHSIGRKKEFPQRFEPSEMRVEPRVTTLGRQPRQTLYDYAVPMAGTTGLMGLPQMSYSNFYGSATSYPKHLRRSQSPEPRRTPGYNNYGYSSEMREIDNAYVVPRVYVENADGRRSPNERCGKEITYEQTRRLMRPRMVLDEQDCVETDIYVEGKLSPSRRDPNEAYPSRCSSPKIRPTEASIREEEEEEITRITRF